MTTKAIRATDDAIRQATIERGCCDASIVPQFVKDYPGVLDGGAWYVLSVRYRDDADWEVLGRRRTRAELLQLAKRGPVDFR